MLAQKWVMILHQSLDTRFKQELKQYMTCTDWTLYLDHVSIPDIWGNFGIWQPAHYLLWAAGCLLLYGDQPNVEQAAHLALTAGCLLKF